MKNKFKKNKKYKSLCMILSPNGAIKKGTILTGEQWKNILIYDVGHDFNNMFKIIK